MPDISKINALAIGSIAKVDGLAKASILDIDGVAVPSAFTGLLDTYTGAVRAYSVRRLNSAYTGAAIRIREAGGNTETDINFNSDGFVNLAAIVSHCGPNAGYIKTWYDQSQSGGTGSGNDATQATPADQPQIYDGTSLRLVNGRLGVGNSTGTLLSFSTFTVSADVYIASVQQYDLGEFAYGGSDCFFFYSTTTEARFRGFGSDLNGTLDLRDSGTQEAFGVVRSGTAAEMFWQGGSVGTVTASSNPTLRDLFDGQNQQTGRYNQSLQEFILWNADHSASQASIDADINSNFLIYQPTDAPTSGLLATYTGAAAAYSVRQLSDKAVIALRIRRDSDDEERNIGFDSNGDLATADISAFCGTANGYVVEWADQSTNGNHASQSTGTSQPQIYNGTAVLTENGKPIIVPSANDTLSTTGIDFTSANTFAFVGTQATGVGVNVLSMDGTPLYVTTSGSTSDCTFGFSPTPVYYHNGTEQTTTPTRGEAYTFLSASQRLLTSVFGDRAGTDVVLGREVGQQMASSQELIIWLTDQESAGNRTGIETDIDNYYAIPGI